MHQSVFSELKMRFRSFRGETALITLEGTVTSSNTTKLLELLEMSFNNDYVTVVFDVSDVAVGSGGLLLLLELQRRGVQFVGAEQTRGEGAAA